MVLALEINYDYDLIVSISCVHLFVIFAMIMMGSSQITAVLRLRLHFLCQSMHRGDSDIIMDI